MDIIAKIFRTGVPGDTGEQGIQGDQGIQGIQGVPGISEVTTNTDTNINGIIGGDGLKCKEFLQADLSITESQVSNLDKYTKLEVDGFIGDIGSALDTINGTVI
jgi:hypothetical protein